MSGAGIVILAACSPGEVRVAAVRKDRLIDYAIWRPGAPDGVGDLHRGRIIARVPAMAGAFVALADAEGFLPDSEGARDRTEGAVLAVRITRAAQGGKGPRLTANLRPDEQALVGAGPPALLARGPNALERFAALYPDAGIVVDDAAIAASLPRTIRDGAAEAPDDSTRAPRRVTIVRDAFTDAIASEVESLASPDVALPGGGSLSIHPTPALVAIDVDSGGAMRERGGKTEQHAAFNRAILPELARQIRLRNLSGAIILDLAGLQARRRQALAPALTAALAADPLRPRFLGFTALGLAEIVRPRGHAPLHELLAGPHAAGLAALRAITLDLAADPGKIIGLRASPMVTAALQADRPALADFARRAGRALAIRSDPVLPPAGWVMETTHE